MRRFLILSAFLLMPSAAFAGCLPTGPAALPCLGGAVIESLDSFLGSRSNGACGSNSHGTIDMFGNKGCAPGAGALSKRAKSATAKKSGTVKSCPMGSVMAHDGRGGTFCKDVPGALHARR